MIKEYKYDFDPMYEIKRLEYWIKEYFATNGPDACAVVGISGGKDSTIAACILARALGKDRVVGVMMPQGEQHDIEAAQEVCKLYCGRVIELNIGNICDSFFKTFDTSLLEKNTGVTSNTPPRIRMAMLYAVAAALNGRVCNTSNLSEKTVGWSTKWGDGCGDFAPLARLTVTELVALGHALKIPDHLNLKVPEDGLTGKSDEENLGVPYSMIDRYIRQDQVSVISAKDLAIINHRENISMHKWCTNIQEFYPMPYIDENNNRHLYKRGSN